MRMTARVDRLGTGDLATLWAPGAGYADAQRPGSTRVRRGCVGRASGTTRPVTSRASSAAVVGLPMVAVPRWSRTRAT